MLLNPDTPTHNEINRWFFSTDVDEILPVIGEVAQRLQPDIDQVLNADSHSGRPLGEISRRSHQVALNTVLELLLGTLDPELSQSSIGKRFKSKVAQVAEKLELREVSLVVREASEEDLRRWFGKLKPLSVG